MTNGERPESGERGSDVRADGGSGLASGQSVEDTADDQVATDADPGVATTVDVKCTGQVQEEVGEMSFEYTFEGDTLRAFLDELFEEYPELQDMLIAETEADATHSGWAPAPEELPGTWTKNPVGEQTIAYARILVNGHFNENENGFDTVLEEGDRVALVYPFMFCC